MSSFLKFLGKFFFLAFLASGNFFLHSLCGSYEAETLHFQPSFWSVVVVVQLLSPVQLFATLWTAARQVSLSFTISEFAQTHAYWVGDAIKPSYPLSLASNPAINLSQHQGLFKWVFASGGQGIEASALASVLPVNIQGLFSLGLTGLISLLSKGLSRVFSSTTVQKHQFFGIQPSLWSNSHIHTWLLEKP